uniref:rRNA adenine N(6)-methyltransferase n=1 Tax=Latimeria chalumnae TaxID=7897 RepID=H3B9X7_LATCH
RNLSVFAGSLKGQHRHLSRFDFLDIGDVEELTAKALACRSLRRFIINPDLARIVVDHLDTDLSDSGTVIFECNPGNIVQQEGNAQTPQKAFISWSCASHFLEVFFFFLTSHLKKKFQGLFFFFFKKRRKKKSSVLTPHCQVVVSPAAFSKHRQVGIPWRTDVPVKVVGILSQRNERNMLWKLIYALYERISIYRYGRIELNMFISEKEYKKLTAKPGNLRYYHALGVLWQMACDIQLLHKEPWSSFVTTSKTGTLAIQRSIQLPNDHLCLVRMTPHRDLFSRSLTTANSATLVLMLKQCLAKRKAKLLDRLDSWSPGSGHKILAQLELPEDIITGHVYPEEYKRLFEVMEQSEEFSQSWLYEEVLENTKTIGFQI